MNTLRTHYTLFHIDMKNTTNTLTVSTQLVYIIINDMNHMNTLRTHYTLFHIDMK